MTTHIYHHSTLRVLCTQSHIFIMVIYANIFLQEDLQIYSKSADSKLIGFPDLGPEGDAIYDMSHGKHISHIIAF